MMKGQTFPQIPYFSPSSSQSAFLKLQHGQKRRPQPSSCISKRASQAWIPRQGVLHWSLVRLNQLYSWLPQSWPVRKGRKLLRPVSDPQEGHINWHSLGMGHANPPFFSQLNQKQQAYMGNEDTQQAKATQLPQVKHTLNFISLTHAWTQIWPCVSPSSFRHVGWLILPDSLKSQPDETESNVRTDAELCGEASTKSHLALRNQQRFRGWVQLWWLLTEKNDASVSWAMKAWGYTLKQA